MYILTAKREKRRLQVLAEQLEHKIVACEIMSGQYHAKKLKVLLGRDAAGFAKIRGYVDPEQKVLRLPGFVPFEEKSYLNLRLLCKAFFNKFSINKLHTPVAQAKFTNQRQQPRRQKLENFKI
jgi:hypothetical protein